eukprot:CAMPEP_0171471138 /NCGR_PEP_ID=MMETSP0946-20130122/530_1 /TAXON_ID=109269 /ORGANISM="Vaucheria litorea, Strain CCMP2940" /LENGTH=833 /DNA_ID=CAMNT_0012000579 /DNA_START=190 /DNA_END=2687 /DNA_ORIENTATION=+
MKFDVSAVNQEMVNFLQNARNENIAVWAILQLAQSKKVQFEDPLEEIKKWMEYDIYDGSSSEDEFDKSKPHFVENINHRVVFNDPLYGNEFPDDFIMISRAFITPTRICVFPPEIEGLNRVTRHYHKFCDRFLRIICSEEDFSKIYKEFKEDTIYESPIARIRYFIKEGIRFCGRHYQYLAHSSSQLRESSCWFYAEPSDTELTYKNSPIPTGDIIRKWMGTFDDINVVAKYAARIGQSFGTTKSTVTVEKFEIIDDIYTKDRRYCFSDGVGRISSSLAMKIAKKLDPKFSNEMPLPSAFQIRFAGAKGMVSLCHNMSSLCDLELRKSQIKFETYHNTMEVMKTSSCMPFFLNRPLIMLLETLKVPRSNVLHFLDIMLEKLKMMAINESVAKTVLLRYGCLGKGAINDSAANAPMNVAWDLLQNGWRFCECDHLRNLMKALQTDMLQSIKKKARVFVQDAVVLFGIMDETGFLNDGEVFVQFKQQDPDTFEFMESKILKGDVLVGRNPSLHPGDLRVLKAVDIPEMHHIIDCVVFPSNGIRPHPSQMSGGDLDGDIFFIIFDEKLIPPYHTRNPPAMDYIAPPPKIKVGPITVEDMKDFFVDYLINDILGMICTYHLVIGDESQLKANCSECLRLVPLASQAVDFAKTGLKAPMPPKECIPKKYPHWFEKRDKGSYTSTSYLADIYDNVLEVIENDAINSNPLDKSRIRHIHLIPGFEKYVEESEINLKAYLYDLNLLMNQFGVFDEASCMCGRAEPGNRLLRGRRNGEANKHMDQQLSFLRKKYRTWFFEEFGQDNNMPVITFRENLEIEKLRKASAWYFVASMHIDKNKQA